MSLGVPVLPVSALLAQDGVASVAVIASIYTAVFFVGIALLWWGRRRSLAWINRQTVAQLQKLGAGHMRRINLRQLLALTRLLVRLLSMALLLVGVAVWLTAILDVLPFTHDIGLQLRHTLWREIGGLLHAAVLALPGIGMVMLVFFLARVAVEGVGHYFRTIETGESTSEVWDGVTASTTRRMATVAIWIGALIVAFPYIPGSDSEAFKGVSLLAGLMLSLGSTNLVGQLVNGLVLIYSRAVRPGDAIITGETEGVVEKLGLFSCAIRTINDEVIWLPNSALAAGLRNFSRTGTGSPVRFTAQVTIGYDTSWQQVRTLLLAAAKAAGPANVLPEPAPLVRQMALEDFYVRYELVFVPADPTKRRVILSALYEEILREFAAAGIQVMSPHYLGDPATAKIPPAGQLPSTGDK